MIRKVVAIWMSLTLMFCFVVIIDIAVDFSPRVKGATLYVNETGSGAYSSIQEAINAANPGDTVFVYNGTYVENVVVDKCINLTGLDKDITIIDGGGSGDVIHVTADWVNITGFTVTGGGSQIIDGAIELDYVENCYVAYNNVSLNGRDGIRLQNTNYSTIMNNTLNSNPEDGIRLEDSFDNVIINNNASYNCAGFGFWKSVNNFIANNTASFNSRGGFSFGFSSQYNTIKNNTAISNTFLGIAFGKSSNNTIQNNHVSNHDYGIRIDTSSHNSIVYNNASNNDFGIFIEYSSKIKVTNNIASFNNVSGIHISGSTNINISNNEMVRNGIFVYGDLLEHWNTHKIDTLNTVNGKSVYYWKNRTSGIIPPGAGEVILANCTDIIVENQEVTNGTVGIEIGFSSNNNLTYNNASSNLKYGIYQYSSNKNNIICNNAYFNEYGIYVYFSNNTLYKDNNVSSNILDGFVIYQSNKNNITNNNISYNRHGIEIDSSSYNKLTNNLMIRDSIFIYGTSLGYWNTHYIDTSNIVNQKPVYYWKNQTGGSIPSGAGEVILANCTGVNVKEQELSYGSVGIELGYSWDNNIMNNIIFSNNRYGLYIQSSDGNFITGNNISNSYRGIYIKYSVWNNLTNNEASNHDDGIFFWYSDNNTIGGNRFNNNDNGIYLASSYDNNIIWNDISNNDYGITLASERNIIYHNKIINNTQQARDFSNNLNQWNNTYPSGGNYWSDYGGVDNLKGPNQDIPGNDGIGDTNYSIDSDSADNYPLMAPNENYLFIFEGWNLISLPLIQNDTKLDIVLSSIFGLYDTVQWYNSSDQENPWKHNHTGKPPEMNNLDNLEHTRGFWIHITTPGIELFRYSGTQPTFNQTITLHSGWNMVGYPSLSFYNRTEGLNNITFGTEVDAIWYFDAPTQLWKKLEESDQFEIGRGYWIHATTQCEWEVPL